jgi:transcriptional regulator of acetoin/glycerol metabolism
MSRFETSRRAIRYGAWAAFVRDGDERALSRLSPALAQSWRRARASGVDPALHWLPLAHLSPPPTGDYLRAELLIAAEHFFQTFASTADEARVLLLLADANGTIIRRAGPRALLRLADRINLVPGAVAAERFIGTNACAEALFTGQISRVDLYEHYCEAFFEWADIAAPVIQPFSGTVLGSLDLVLWKKPLNGQLHLLAKAAASSVECHLRERAQRDHVCLLENLQRQSRAPDAAAFLLDDHGIVRAALPECARWIGGTQSLELGEPVTSIAELRHLDDDILCHARQQKSIQPVPIALADSESLVLLSRAEPGTGPGCILAQFIRKTALPNSRRVTPNSTSFCDIIGHDPGLRQLLEYAGKAAATSVPVFIAGETGTGKELVARGIHQASRRATGPFVAINCGAISPDLVAAELFGHVPGAFTGAARAGRVGKFVQADGGTLFLDEITESSSAFQVALLRVLQEGEVIPVGSNTPVKVDVRVIAASNRPIDEATLQPQILRQDLYFRLSSILLQLPPLRERNADIPLLAAHILANLNPAREITPAALAALQTYTFPGNVRELQSILQRAALLAADIVIQITDLPAHLLKGAPSTAVVPHDARDLSLREMESQTLRSALIAHGGNARQAANALGIPRSTLYRKIVRLELTALLGGPRSGRRL